MKKEFAADPVIKFFISLMGLVVLFFIMKELQDIFLSLVIAFFLYFIFEPVNRRLAKIKFPLPVIIILDLIIIIGAVVGLWVLIVPQLQTLSSNLPQYSEGIRKSLEGVLSAFGIKSAEIENGNFFNEILKLDYTNIASDLIGSFVSFLSNSFFIVFCFIFISSGFDKLLEAVKNWYLHIDDDGNEFNPMPGAEIIEKNRQEFEQTFKGISEQIQRYIITKVAVSIITSLAVGLVLFIFRVDFVIIWMLLAFLLNFIPNIGSVIAILLPTLFAMIQFESAGYALLIGGILVVIQNLMGNILEPKIMGNELGLNPLVILLSLLLWGYIWGIPGMILSVPLTAVIKIMISNSRSKNLILIRDLMEN